VDIVDEHGHPILDKNKEPVWSMAKCGDKLAMIVSDNVSAEIDADYFVKDENYLSTNWSQDNGKNYLRKISAAGRPDVFRGLLDLHEAIIRVEEEYAERAGFKVNTALNESIRAQLEEAVRSEGQAFTE